MSKVVLRMMLALFVGAFFVSGCGSSPKKGPGGSRIHDIGTEVLGDIPQVGEPFDVSLTPVTDVSFANVYFAYDSFVVERGEVSKVEKVAAYMKANSRVRLIAEGHCDERGTKEYNQALAENRSSSVRTYLTQLGIPAANIQTRSYGEERPVDPGHNESAWRKNRRVEFAFFR
jgi:peptidoglycan-associated lipoprotein